MGRTFSEACPSPSPSPSSIYGDLRVRPRPLLCHGEGGVQKPKGFQKARPTPSPTKGKERKEQLVMSPQSPGTRV